MGPHVILNFLLAQYLVIGVFYGVKGDWGRAWYFFAAFQINFTAMYLIK